MYDFQSYTIQTKTKNAWISPEFDLSEHWRYNDTSNCHCTTRVTFNPNKSVYRTKNTCMFPCQYTRHSKLPPGTWIYLKGEFSKVINKSCLIKGVIHKQDMPKRRLSTLFHEWHRIMDVLLWFRWRFLNYIPVLY